MILCTHGLSGGLVKWGNINTELKLLCFHNSVLCRRHLAFSPSLSSCITKWVSSIQLLLKTESYHKTVSLEREGWKKRAHRELQSIKTAGMLTLRVQELSKTKVLLCKVKSILQIVVCIWFLQLVKINQIRPRQDEKFFRFPKARCSHPQMNKWNKMCDSQKPWPLRMPRFRLPNAPAYFNGILKELSNTQHSAEQQNLAHGKKQG